jgi:hypothetical protein
VTPLLELGARAGQVMLVVAAGVTLVALLAVLPRALRVRRLAKGLHASLVAWQAEVEAALERLMAGREETEALLLPWRRLRRWLRHPLVVALFQWQMRRRRRSAT